MIAVDMTWLKHEGHIQPQPPSEYSTPQGPNAPPHWRVQFNLVMIVDGRNLRYEVRWPIVREGEAPRDQSVQASGQICIAAGFKPGVA
jgi:hypothetical protein